MAQNIFTSENLEKYKVSPPRNTIWDGRWVERNGVPAIVTSPTWFWKSKNEMDGVTEWFLPIFSGEMSSDKTYLFDMWVDTDDVVYNGSNVRGGLRITLTNGELAGYPFAPQSSGSDGWQHKRYVLSGVTKVWAYYYTNQPVYWRWDSSITEYDTASVKKSGTFKDGIFKEDKDSFSMDRGGGVYGNSIIEV